MNSIGNINAFSKDVVRIVATILGLGYMGGSIISLLHLNEREMNQLFPTDINHSPYTVTPSEKISLGESRKRGLVYALSQINVPYGGMTITHMENASTISEANNWLKLTCAYVFILWRHMYKTIFHYLSISLHDESFSSAADFIYFYIAPYIAIMFITSPTIIPMVGYVLSTVMSAFVEQVSHPLVFTFSLVMGWLYGMLRIFDDLTKFPAGIINMFGYGFGGMLLSAVKHPYWFGIGGGLWLFSFTYLYLAPFFLENGVNRVINEIIAHKNGLLFIFMVSVLTSAKVNLSAPVATGLMIFVIGYYLYELYKWFKSTQHSK